MPDYTSYYEVIYSINMEIIHNVLTYNLRSTHIWHKSTSLKFKLFLQSIFVVYHNIFYYHSKTFIGINIKWWNLYHYYFYVYKDKVYHK
jgi:hypothetical protein